MKIRIEDSRRAYARLPHRQIRVKLPDEWSELFQRTVPVELWTIGFVTCEGTSDEAVLYERDGTLYRHGGGDVPDSARKELAAMGVSLRKERSNGK